MGAAVGACVGSVCIGVGVGTGVVGCPEVVRGATLEDAHEDYAVRSHDNMAQLLEKCAPLLGATVPEEEVRAQFRINVLSNVVDGAFRNTKT